MTTKKYFTPMNWLTKLEVYGGLAIARIPVQAHVYTSMGGDDNITGLKYN